MRNGPAHGMLDIEICMDQEVFASERATLINMWDIQEGHSKPEQGLNEQTAIIISLANRGGGGNPSSGAYLGLALRHLVEGVPDPIHRQLVYLPLQLCLDLALIHLAHYGGLEGGAEGVVQDLAAFLPHRGDDAAVAFRQQVVALEVRRGSLPALVGLDPGRVQGRLCKAEPVLLRSYRRSRSVSGGGVFLENSQAGAVLQGHGDENGRAHLVRLDQGAEVDEELSENLAHARTLKPADGLQQLAAREQLQRAGPGLGWKLVRIRAVLAEGGPQHGPSPDDLGPDHRHDTVLDVCLGRWAAAVAEDGFGHGIQLLEEEVVEGVVVLLLRCGRRACQLASAT